MVNLFKVTRSQRIIFISGSLFHLIIGQLYFDFWDWNVLWVAADFVSQGHNYYELGYPPYNTGVYFHPPYQMPYFIYFLSIFAYIGSQGLARFTMSLIFILAGKFIIGIAKEEMKKEVTVFYFFNPFGLYVSYLGFFDVFPTILVVASLAASMKNKHLTSGLIIGIAIMTKVFALSVFYLVFAIFFLNQKITDLTKYGIGAMLAILPFSIYYYQLNRKAFSLRAGVYHLRRDDQGLSFLTTWFSLTDKNDFRFTIFLILFLILTLAFAIPYYRVLITNLYLTGLISVTIFLVVTPILFPHYLIWPMIFLLLFFSQDDIRESKYITRNFLLKIIISYSTGSLIWGSRTIFSNNVLSDIFEHISSIMIFFTNLYVLYTSSLICRNLAITFERGTT